jgi:isoquinoline 1-oxidoreductase beta subunit
MSIVKVDRRDFVKIAGAGSAGLVIGLRWPSSMRAAVNSPNALGTYVEIGAGNDVTIYVPHTEMGQGVRTSLPMIVAEELDADWGRVKVKQADLDARFGSQGTGGSGSVQGRWMELRRAGATARAMLVVAAASQWGVDPKDCTVAKGVIRHGQKQITFGAVADAAAKLPVPREVALKDPSTFTIVGRKTNRLDNPDTVRGKARYGIDVRVPGMLYASVERSPVFGGKPASFDATKAKAIPGVRHVVQIDALDTDLPWSGVAVVADSTWAAVKGRKVLDVKWDEGSHAKESSAAVRAAMVEALSKGDATRFRNRGDVEAALSSASKKIEAVYEVPLLAHATMEPQNATVHVSESGAEIWAPTQFPDAAARVVARVLKIRKEQIKVHVTLLGGAFGRRINSDYVAEAALISKTAGAPIHVQWTREDDMTHDFYRPTSMHRLAGALDGEGKLVAISHRMTSPSVRAYYRGPKGENLHEARGLDEIYELVPHTRGEFALVDSGVPRGWWRSVGSSANGFVIQSFLDELAHAAGKDPIDFQLALLGHGVVIPSGDKDEKDYPFRGDRVRKVIETVREKSGWGTPLPAGHARGFAWMYDALTPCAEVAEVSLTKDGTPRVHRVVAAIDCGIAVNPDGVAAQVEGGIAFGLTAALKGRISVANGRVEQSNFHDYEMMRMSEMPVIEVHIVPSRELPTGTGEPPVPPIAPAVANALFALTGKRVRSLPIDPRELQKADG